MTLIAVLDYGIGNLRSAQKALQQSGPSRLTADPGLVAEAAGVVLPGCRRLRPVHGGARGGGLDELAIEAPCSGPPFLGICVGMQMLYQGSEETPACRAWGFCPAWCGCLPTA